jgi:CRISPR/Cas system endoribonuclease Cas6 (RAMP superfamily)
MSLSSTAPTQLYALHLRLRPLQPGTLMPFNGELVHGAFLRWLRLTAPDVAAWLHEKNKRRLFSCSSLRWPLPATRMEEAQRNNTHLPVDPQQTYLIRITLLLGDLFSLLYRTLMEAHTTQGSSRPFVQIGKQLFHLEDVSIDNDGNSANDASGWTGFTSLDELAEQALARRSFRSSRSLHLTLEFDSLTTFNRGGHQNGEYGPFAARLPLPEYVFSNLAKRWQDIAPAELVGLVQPEHIEHYIAHYGAVIEDYNLKPHSVHFTTHVQPGFLGTCTYLLRGPDQETPPDAPLSVQQQLWLLAQLGFYSGVGYKTPQGMGRMRAFTHS